jgi:hypothetical protein
MPGGLYHGGRLLLTSGPQEDKDRQKKGVAARADAEPRLVPD